MLYLSEQYNKCYHWADSICKNQKPESQIHNCNLWGKVICHELYHDIQYVPALGRVYSTNGEKSPCHNGWAEGRPTIIVDGFEPVSQFQCSQEGQWLMSYLFQNLKDKIVIEINSISHIRDFISECTNTSICFDNHITLIGQVGNATLELHGVNSSGYNNDPVSSTNINLDEYIMSQVQEIVGMYDTRLIEVHELLSSYNQHVEPLYRDAGTRQSHNSSHVYINKSQQSFSQLLVGSSDDILFNSVFSNSSISYDRTTSTQLFASTLVSNTGTRVIMNVSGFSCSCIY